MTAEYTRAVDLKRLTRRELAQQAKRRRISGWHGMKKDALIQALLSRARSERRRAKHQQQSRRPERQATTGNGTRNRGGSNGHTANTKGQNLDLSCGICTAKRPNRDLVEATANDAYWIHVQWSFTKTTIRRAEAALGSDWHQAIPVIRIFDVTKGDADGPDYQRQLRDIEIHGDVNYWYVPVDRPARSYRLHIGYRTPGGKFQAIGKTRVVRTPRAGVNGTVDHTWKRDTKPASLNGHHKSSKGRTNGHAARRHTIDPHDFPFRVDAELIVHGETHPQAELTLLGEPVKISREGRFSLRFALPDGRQVIPAVTVTPSGKEQHTIVLSVERNTRELDPQRMDEMV